MGATRALKLRFSIGFNLMMQSQNDQCSRRNPALRPVQGRPPRGSGSWACREGRRKAVTGQGSPHAWGMGSKYASSSSTAVAGGSGAAPKPLCCLAISKALQTAWDVSSPLRSYGRTNRHEAL